ncbi:hypothetical protein SNEBB_009791 [Seison nebaliae]|nr:hypothetical protein SNEBB_009791 [Seison nebaliae]
MKDTILIIISIICFSNAFVKNLMLSEPFLKQKFPSKIEPKLTNVSNVSTECLREKDQLKIGISTFSHDYSKELLISRLQLLYELAIRRKYELMNINDIGPDGNSQIVWCSFEDLFGDEKVFTNDIIKKNHEAIWMKFVVVNGTDGVIDSGTVRDTFALLSEQQLSIYLNEETLGNVQLSKNDSTLKRRYQYWIIGAVFGAMIAFFLILWAILAPYYICVRPPVKEQHELNGSWRDPAFLERTMTARRLLSTRIADMSNLQSAKIQDEYLQNLYINSFKKNTETESDDRKNDNWSVNSERIEEISKEEKQRRKKNRKQQKVLPETIRNREMIEQMREKTRYK